MGYNLSNVVASEGHYRFYQSGTRYEYWPDSRDMYRLTYQANEWTFIYLGKVEEVQHQQLINALSVGGEVGSATPVEPDPVFTIPMVPQVPPLSPPKFIPSPTSVVLGKVPQTSQYRASGIGVVPGISPVRFDKSYRPKTVDMKKIPDSAEGMWEFIRNVVGQQIRQSAVYSPFMAETWTRRR